MSDDVALVLDQMDRLLIREFDPHGYLRFGCFPFVGFERLETSDFGMWMSARMARSNGGIDEGSCAGVGADWSS
jgi:hypothetical protein